MKKFLTYFLVVLMVVFYSNSINCTADEYKTNPMSFQNSILEEMISEVIYDQGISVDGCVYLGNGIVSYYLMDDGYVKTDHLIYPVFINEDVTLVVIQNEDGNIQITQLYVNQFNSLKGREIAVVYGPNNSFIVCQDSESPIEVCQYPEEPNMQCLNNHCVISNSEIILNKINPDLKINVNKSILSKDDPLMPAITLNVPVKLQVYSQICWAASTASIGQYLTSINYTAQYVAEQKYGSNFNQGATLYISKQMLNSLYGVSYPYVSTSTAPTDVRIYNNLSNGYPLYGRWHCSSGANHQTVLRGLNHTMGYLYVMDPLQGNVLCQKSSGTYSYVGASGYSFTLFGYLSKY